MKRYNEALVASPRNETFYRNEIPLEMFMQPDVEISISTAMKSLDESQEIAMELRLVNGDVFTLAGDVRYLFSSDGRQALLFRFESSSDLMLVENFR